jgi:RNA polymerase sigma-70 factor, ECF subfamily
MADLLKPVVLRRDIGAPKPSETGKLPIGRDESTKTPTPRSGPLIGLTDKELVLKAIEGNTEAYSELVNRYQNEVRSLARAIVRSHQSAEDLSQDAFIKAFHSLSDLKEPEKFGGWICTILRHTALDFLRASKNMASLETLQEEGFEPKLEAPELGASVLEAHEEESRALDALKNLREDYREIIVLKHVEKLSYKEIAKRLNMSVSAVGEKLSRVRSLLKRRLEKLPVKSARAKQTEKSSAGADGSDL